MQPTPPSRALLSAHAPTQPWDPAVGVRVHQAIDLFALWTAWEGESNQRCEPPFWAVVWPAARTLARHIHTGAIAVAGKRVLDLGCGGGAIAITAMLSGAEHAIANDVDPTARYIAGENAAHNGIALALDGRDLTLLERLPECDLILAADFFYEAAPSHRLLALLDDAHRHGTAIVLGDAGRTFFPRDDLQLLAEERIAVDRAIEDADQRIVRLWSW